ncbi:MAG: translational GTPase TypA [Actinomycetota bacterium]|nr:translational GTPase TypA [Actinomycetota bacterium]
MPIRTDLRNVAIVAHVDHGKTTLVDALMRQSGAFRANQEVEERVLDSMDLEREKGITILAKQAALHHDGVKLNIVDTPGHADFGGEVERALAMVDGAMLLVDAAEGPLPQTRFVLRKALAARLPIVLVINKLDRPDARPAEVLDAVYELFIENGADESQIEFPVLYACGRDGWVSTDADVVGTDLRPLLDSLVEHIPAPSWEEDAPLQALVTNLDASPFLGRLAICRVMAGSLRRGQAVTWCRRDGTQVAARVGEVFVTEALDRVSVKEAGPGELVALSGLQEITIGETLADPADPRPLPPLHIDEPSLAVTIGVNTSPLAGRDGTKMTARLIKSRLDAELVGNVSIRVEPTDRPDTWEVQGRGELALAVLVELMRREGFELSVGKPQVLTRTIDGVLHEPVERLEVDVPEEHLGTLTQLLSERRGRYEKVDHSASGWVRMEWVVPARGLVGIRSEVMTQTRGTAILHHAFDSWQPWAGEMPSKRGGSLIADREGKTTTYALLGLEPRGTLFVGPGESVYAGMVIGENSRPDDMDVNPARERKLTNVRSSTAEELVRLRPPQRLTLESALEMIDEDEMVEVTPSAVRVRKTVLDQSQRNRLRSRERKPAAASGNR